MTTEREPDFSNPSWSRADAIITPRFTIAPLRRPEFEAYLYAPDDLAQAWRLDAPLERPPQYQRRAFEALYCKGLAYDAENYVWGTLWLIVERATARVVGRLCYKGAPRNDAVEFAYATDRTERNRGVMTEALLGACRWLTERADVEFAFAETTRKNVASQCVLIKAGFDRVKEGKDTILWARSVSIPVGS